MARGKSGRIVVEMPPAEKDDLYTALAADGKTLKQWFMENASEYVSSRGQLPLFPAKPELRARKQLPENA